MKLAEIEAALAAIGNVWWEDLDHVREFVTGDVANGSEADVVLIANAPDYLRALLAALQQRDELLRDVMEVESGSYLRAFDRSAERAAVHARIRALLERGGA